MNDTAYLVFGGLLGETTDIVHNIEYIDEFVLDGGTLVIARGDSGELLTATLTTEDESYTIDDDAYINKMLEGIRTRREEL